MVSALEGAQVWDNLDNTQGEKREQKERRQRMEDESGSDMEGFNCSVYFFVRRWKLWSFWDTTP